MLYGERASVWERRVLHFIIRKRAQHVGILFRLYVSLQWFLVAALLAAVVLDYINKNRWWVKWHVLVLLPLWRIRLLWTFRTNVYWNQYTALPQLPPSTHTHTHTQGTAQLPSINFAPEESCLRQQITPSQMGSSIFHAKLENLKADKRSKFYFPHCK